MPNPDELFAIVPVEGTKSPPEAIVVGPMSEVMKYIRDTIPRIEEEQRLAQTQKDAEETERHHDEVRTTAAQMLADGLEHISNRLDQFETRKAEREDQQRRDEEEAEARAIEEMLDAIPDPDSPDVETALK